MAQWSQGTITGRYTKIMSNKIEKHMGNKRSGWLRNLCIGSFVNVFCTVDGEVEEAQVVSLEPQGNIIVFSNELGEIEFTGEGIGTDGVPFELKEQE